MGNVWINKTRINPQPMIIRFSTFWASKDWLLWDCSNLLNLNLFFEFMFYLNMITIVSIYAWTNSIYIKKNSLIGGSNRINPISYRQNCHFPQRPQINSSITTPRQSLQMLQWRRSNFQHLHQSKSVCDNI